jgi:hypothetical protein
MRCDRHLTPAAAAAAPSPALEPWQAWHPVRTRLRRPWPANQETVNSAAFHTWHLCDLDVSHGDAVMVFTLSL